MGVCEIVFAGRDPVWSQLESGGLKARGRETSCSSKHGVHAEADAERGPGRVGQGCQCHPSRRCKRYLRGRCRNWECRYHSLGTLGCKVRLIYNYLLLIVSVTIILLLHKIQTSHLYYHHVFSEAEWRPINVYYIDPLGFLISRQSAIESAQIPSVDMHTCFCVVCILIQIWWNHLMIWAVDWSYSGAPSITKELPSLRRNEIFTTCVAFFHLLYSPKISKYAINVPHTHSCLWNSYITASINSLQLYTSAGRKAADKV